MQRDSPRQPRPASVEGRPSRPATVPPRHPPPNTNGGRPRDQRGRPPAPRGDPLQVGRRYALLDAGGETLIGRVNPDAAGQSIPIQVDGRTVGTLHVARLSGFDSIDEDFDRQQLRTVYITLAVAIAIAAALSALLARHLTRPIRSLTAGANAIAGGDYTTKISADRSDELGELARDFNRLAETLNRNRESRRQWIADIAHELRTPLSILRGELDAVEDGVRVFDLNTRQSLQFEIARLTKLVADLHQLSVSDEGRLTPQYETVDIAALLRKVAQRAKTRVESAGLTLTTDLPTTSTDIDADPLRLEQLFTNLVENSLRYTTAPGKMQITCRREDRDIVIEIADSAPAVPDDALERLFDRLYRVDESRNRATGGSGLGLAICKAIVDAHEGSIRADHSPLGGVAITVRLPVAAS